MVKAPAWRLLTCTWMVKAVSAAMSSPGAGEIRIEETMLPCEGMSPMTIPLQEPPCFWRPSVLSLPVQKLMKLASSLWSVRMWKEDKVSEVLT